MDVSFERRGMGVETRWAFRQDFASENRRVIERYSLVCIH